MSTQACLGEEMERHDPVSQAMHDVRREWFLPAAARGEAAYDGPVSIGHGMTNSQPRTVAAMLRLLEVGPGDRVLDVGAGSGWTTALLAHLAGPDGSVLGLELVPELATWGAANLAGLSLAHAVLREADAEVLGDPGSAPHDRILVSAGARSLPRELVDQLADGGRMVVPVQGTMTLVVRRADEVSVSEHGNYRFVPLLGPGQHHER